MKRALPAAALLGAASVAGFAPLYWFPVPILTLALLIALWDRAGSRSQAALIGLAFGLGHFITGVSWVYVSLHDYGALPAPVAAGMTLLFCAILACYPAITGWCYRALGTDTFWMPIAALPALWTAGEWLRGWLFTGFPWIALGYSQVPHSPLAGYAPLAGIYGTTYASALVAAALFALWKCARARAAEAGPVARPKDHRVATGLRISIALVVCVPAGGYLLRGIEWTIPAGAPVTVSLLQGNVAQEMKWRPERVRSTLATYSDLVAKSSARLIVMPETALPLYWHDVPEGYLDGLAARVRAHGGDILLGAPERTDARNYYNSVISIGTSPTQTYRKSHLVPFGEFVPLKPLFGWFLDVAQIPLLDFSRGGEAQQPLAVAGQHVAVNICYEDAFGEEIIRQLPQATLLVNVSNVAWFGRSIAPSQHLQISQARALESGRYMLRATNTGITAIIDQRGNVVHAAPEYTTAIVNGEVQGFQGATPYVRWGNVPVIALALLQMLAVGWLALRRTGRIQRL